MTNTQNGGNYPSHLFRNMRGIYGQKLILNSSLVCSYANLRMWSQTKIKTSCSLVLVNSYLLHQSYSYNEGFCNREVTKHVTEYIYTPGV